MIFDTSAIDQTHGFSLFLRCWWMEVRNKPVGLRQSVTSSVYKLYTDMLFSPINACILRVLSYKVVNFFVCKLRSKRRVSSDHAGMKEVSIFCLWTNWIHLVTCSEIEFRKLHCCSRCALDKLFEIYTFDRCPQGWSGQKSFLACGDAKKENWRTTKLLLKYVSYTLFMGKNKRKLFPDGKSRGPLLARAALNYLCDSRRNEMDHNLVSTPSNGHVNNHAMSQMFYKIASDACLQFQYHCQSELPCLGSCKQEQRNANTASGLQVGFLWAQTMNTLMSSFSIDLLWILRKLIKSFLVYVQYLEEPS